MFSSWVKFPGLLLVISFVFVAAAWEDSERKVPLRFKRQFDNAEASLQNALFNLQQQQQLQQQQNGGSNFGFNPNTGNGQQFGQQPFNQSPWNNPNAGNQGFSNNNQNAQNVIRPQTTQRTPVNQIASQNTVNEAQCIRNCPATNQWNPVCGTDNISYGNVNQLRCAQQCGRQVAFVYNGACVTTPSPNK